jgi:hypothetical protein
VTFCYQYSPQFARHIFVEEDPHAAADSFSWASSRSAPCTAFSLSVG